jgi:hypothetical protein
MTQENQLHAVGFDKASEIVGLSKSTLRKFANDPDPAKRLPTVRFLRRRMIRVTTLLDWFERQAQEGEK